MSVYNIKERCSTIGITLKFLWKTLVKKNPKYKTLTYQMFSSMHTGTYSYGMSRDVLSIANEILIEMEKKQ